ncbi:PREDICTED: COX assembly mitochondrial protein homolog [Charadrius vociferus]|nr:PREDICTED: COX assembly mitochondrial protein homolog [Charadrius vociferus]
MDDIDLINSVIKGVTASRDTAPSAALKQSIAKIAVRETPIKLPLIFLRKNSKLRHVEKDVLIPQIMRDRAKELCSDKVQAFTKCCQETGLLMVVKCRQENTALKDCLVGYYSDPLFYEECKTEYLKQREEYRATGIKKKRQKITSNV